MFTYNTTVTLRDTDSFGLIYFTEQLNYCSEAFQAFLTDRGIPLPANPREATFVLPVVHCQSDFSAPLRLGDPVQVEIDSIKMGTSSVRLTYSVYKQGTKAGSAEMVHVCINPETGKSIELPPSFREVVL